MSTATSLPRPRIGIVRPDGPEGSAEPLTAVAVRAVELALLDRLPAARVDSTGAGALQFDLLIALPGAVAEAAEAPVVRLPGDLLGVAAAGPWWMPAQLGESLLGSLRLLDRLPSRGRFLLCDPDPAARPAVLDRLEAEPDLVVVGCRPRRPG